MLCKCIYKNVLYIGFFYYLLDILFTFIDIFRYNIYIVLFKNRTIVSIE